MSSGPSIYRRHAALVYAIAGPVDSGERNAPVTPNAPVDFTQQRKASPVAFLLPSTRKWLDALPRRVQPHALCELYPRVANLVAAMWREPETLKAYFDDLLIDRRGGRRGFPPAVANDLRVLRAFHAALTAAAVRK
ncbi:MAG TPA: hypothetical protein VF814_17185 [Casimicrobiaceae bacterium]